MHGDCRKMSCPGPYGSVHAKALNWGSTDRGLCMLGTFSMRLQYMYWNEDAQHQTPVASDLAHAKLGR